MATDSYSEEDSRSVRGSSISDDGNSDTESFQPTVQLQVSKGRTARTKKLPAKLRGYTQTDVLPGDRKVTVVCNQTGKKISTKVDCLSKENMQPLQMKDIAGGSQLLYESGGKSYPVTVIVGDANKENKPREEKGKKRPLTTTSGSKPKKTKTGERESSCLTLAREEFADPELKSYSEVEVRGLTEADRALLINIDRKLDRLLMQQEKAMTQQETLMTNGSGGQVRVKKEGGLEVEVISEEYMVNGVNLLRIPARDPYAYGRRLLDVLFTKGEQKASILLPSKKTPKPPLDQERVQKLFGCLDRRYRDGYDHKTLVASLNQKCRDAKEE